MLELVMLILCGLSSAATAGWCIYRLRCSNETVGEAAQRLVTLGGGPRPTIPK